MIKQTIIDVVALLGLASITFGAWLLSEPAGFIIGGALTFFACVAMARSGGAE